MSRRCLISVCLLLACGCSAPRMVGFSDPGPVSNPLLVTSTNEEFVWEKTVDVLHSLSFEIERENRLGRVLQTVPKPGASILEPWHPDSVGLANRVESSLQSIRRIVVVQLLPEDRLQGFLVNVAVYKEVEDVPGVAANSAGAATFSESTPMQRDLIPVVGQTTPSVWIPAGRDADLEQLILQRMHTLYSL